MMREEDSDLLQTVDGPYHPNIKRSREQHFAKKKSEKERQLVEKACVYYQNEWVLEKEKELQDLQKQEDAATDPETKRALQCIIEVAVDALKSRFQREEILRLKQQVLQERQKKGCATEVVFRRASKINTYHMGSAAVSQRCASRRSTGARFLSHFS